MKDVFEIGFGQQVKVLGFDAESLAAQFDLPFRLFAGNVKHERVVARSVYRRPEQERAFADARIAADQNERAGHDAAAEHAIELSDAGGNANVVLRFDLGERRQLRRREVEPVAPPFARRAFFDERVPLATFGTLSEPLARLCPQF